MTLKESGDRIFSIAPDGSQRAPVNSMVRLAERLLGMDDCRAVYTRVAGRDDALNFMRAVLDELGVRAAVDPRELERIPDSPLRQELVLLLGELVAYCASPRCAECQGDGVPCGSLLRPCDGCPDCVGRVTELRNLLKSGA